MDPHLLPTDIKIPKEVYVTPDELLDTYKLIFKMRRME